jgi:hypothetical protein
MESENTFSATTLCKFLDCLGYHLHAWRISSQRKDRRRSWLVSLPRLLRLLSHGTSGFSPALQRSDLFPQSWFIFTFLALLCTLKSSRVSLLPLFRSDCHIPPPCNCPSASCSGRARRPQRCYHESWRAHRTYCSILSLV